ncbi:hypothetical protein ABBQ32_010649 [Trebouxia sp. C0010 RCD-2024]
MSHPPPLGQRPPAGLFDKTDLQWVPRRISKGANKDQLVQEAYILADRCDYLLQGECTRGQTQYRIAKREKNDQIINRVQRSGSEAFGMSHMHNRTPLVLVRVFIQP